MRGLSHTALRKQGFCSAPPSMPCLVGRRRRETLLVCFVIGSVGGGRSRYDAGRSTGRQCSCIVSSGYDERPSIAPDRIHGGDERTAYGVDETRHREPPYDDARWIAYGRQPRMVLAWGRGLFPQRRGDRGRRDVLTCGGRCASGELSRRGGASRARREWDVGRVGSRGPPRARTPNRAARAG